MQANAASVVISKSEQHVADLAGSQDGVENENHVPDFLKSQLENNNNNIKAELFNKLVAIQSQQQIHTIDNSSNNNGGDNLSQISSSAQIYSHNHDHSQELIAGCIIDQQPQAPVSQQQQQQSAQHVQHYQAPNNELDVGQQQQQQLLNTSDENSNISPGADSKKNPVVFSRTRSRWYTNEEVSSILTNFKSHPEWQTNELQVRPKSGAVLLYLREKVRYRQDGYCWKKRKNGRTTREDHMKLKVQGIECIYGCYVHSAILPTFHRRCYWLLQNPDIVLVHYLNQPPDDQSKMMITFNPGLLEADTRRSWTNEEIIEEIGSVFGGVSQIQHMLNINFPSSTATMIQPQRTRTQSHDDKSHRLQADTSNQTKPSRPLDDQMDSVPLVDQGLPCGSPVELSFHSGEQQNGDRSELKHLVADTSDDGEYEGDGDDEDDEDRMTAMKLDDSNDGVSIDHVVNQRNEATNLQSNTTNQAQHDSHLDQSKNDVTFDIAEDCNATSNNVDCFRYDKSIDSANADILSASDNNNNINQSASLEQSNNHIEQNFCSPVTQIYNKIVDDIETYVLPFGPNHFDTDHHHHHHHQHHHQHHQDHNSMPIQPMEVVESSSKHRNHENVEGHQRHIELGAGGESVTGKQYMHSSQLQSDVTLRQSACSMDLAAECDLFGPHEDEDQCRVDDVRSRVNSHEVVDDNLLLTEFDLQTSTDHVGREPDDLGTGVVDSLTNAEELRDLIMGMSSDAEQVDQTNSSVDNNPLDIFNFKVDYDNHQSRVQLDLQSSTSDTETMNRISPLISMPRCNSTGNAMQGPMHCDHQYLAASGEAGHQMNNLMVTSTFDELLADTSSNNPQRSLSTNPVNNSISRSPTPSTSSLQITKVGENSNPNQRDSNLFMSAPQGGCRQRRQKSEQRALDNSVLSTLLPKAVSLDSKDLSTTCQSRAQFQDQSRHRLSNSPLISYENSHFREQQDGCSRNLLLVSQGLPNNPIYSSQTINNSSDNNNHHHHGHQHINLGSGTHQRQVNLGSSLSPAIPTTNNSDILINKTATTSDTRFQHGSPTSYNHSNALYSSQQSLAMNQPLIGQNRKSSSSISSCVLPILDYVPNWSNITGGAKVLIVGNWSSLLNENAFNIVDQHHHHHHHNNHKQQLQLTSMDKDVSNSPFYAIFDDLIVPATLIQDNVLRCYAPSHEQGFITLKILYVNRIVSEQVLFEMRPSCNQAATKQVVSVSYPKNNNNQSSQDCTSIDNNNNMNMNQSGATSNNTIGNSNSNTQQQQHRNSTSSNHSASSNSVFANQSRQSQMSPLDSGDNLKVLTLAENIISAMHKKNNSSNKNNNNRSSDFRLANSLDIESLDHYQKQAHNQSQIYRNKSIKASQRYFNASRSLSRDSEPMACHSSSSYAAMDFGVIDNDPYWHQNTLATDSSQQQPLSLVTDFFQANQSGGAMMFGQERHSIGSSSGSFMMSSQQQSSAFTPYSSSNNNNNNNQQQRPILGSTIYQVLASQGHCLPNNESQNMTETSSSGLGSIVSSLSPSTSSLHSPSSASAVATNRADAASNNNNNNSDDQSPTCSCGRQSTGTPTSADFCEYFQASAKTEESFASLTLNDHEQHELYEAAKIIQKAYRTYRGRKRQASELLIEPECSAAALPEHVAPTDYQSATGGGGAATALSSSSAATATIAPAVDLLDVERSAHSRTPSVDQHTGAARSPGQHNFKYLNHQAQQPTLVRCYRDREMQAATIIQAYYRRYRQYVHYKRQQAQLRALSQPLQVAPMYPAQQQQQQQQSICGGQRSPNARLVVDTLPIVIDKATTSHVDRKRFKTAVLMSSNSCASVECSSKNQQ